MELSDILKKSKDKLVKNGLKECKSQLQKQKTETMKEFYKGSIEGLKICKGLNSLDDLANWIKFAYEQEDKNSLEYDINFMSMDDFTRGLAKENNIQVIETADGKRLFLADQKEREKQALNKVWYAKGVGAQLEFVYNRLLAYDFVRKEVFGIEQEYL